MRRSINLTSGVNAVLINHLRNFGGSAEVNCRLLSRQNGFHPSHVWSAANYLSKLGLLKMQRNNCRRPSLITLNEEAILEYQNRPMVTANTTASRVSKPRQKDHPMVIWLLNLYDEAHRLHEIITRYEYINTNCQQLTGPLLETAKTFLAKCIDLGSRFKNVVTDVFMLTEAARSLGAEEQDIATINVVEADQIAKAADYEELAAVPTIDFYKLLTESATFFKQLAILHVKTRELRNLLIEVQRELIRLNLVRVRLNEFINKLQNVVPSTDLTAEFTDWQKHSTRYFRGRILRSSFACKI